MSRFRGLAWWLIHGKPHSRAGYLGFGLIGALGVLLVGAILGDLWFGPATGAVIFFALYVALGFRTLRRQRI